MASILASCLRPTKGPHEDTMIPSGAVAAWNLTPETDSQDRKTAIGTKQENKTITRTKECCTVQLLVPIVHQLLVVLGPTSWPQSAVQLRPNCALDACPRTDVFGIALQLGWSQPASVKNQQKSPTVVEQENSVVDDP